MSHGSNVGRQPDGLESVRAASPWHMTLPVRSDDGNETSFRGVFARSTTTGGGTGVSVLVIILIIIVVLALLGYFGRRRF